MARIVVIAMFVWGVGIAFTFYRLNRDRPIVKLHEASSALMDKVAGSLDARLPFSRITAAGDVADIAAKGG